MGSSGEGRRYRRMLGDLLEFLTHYKRNAEIIQLAADERRLELEVMMGIVSDDELRHRIQALNERFDALKKGGGDGQR